MIRLAQPDRWTCPRCQRTEVPLPGIDDAVHNYIVRAQEEHGRRHAAERGAR